MMKFIPARFHFFIFSIKSFLLFEYRQTTYAQAGEDRILSFIFRDKKPRFYVDIGAHHPLRGSNTHLLYKKGWSGLNVEPNPSLLFLFKIFRHRDISISAGVAGKDGVLDYFMFSEPGVNTFSPEEAEKRIKKGNVPFLKKVSLPVYTLKTLFEKNNIKEIDFLSIDAEGMDFEVLQSNDWEKWKPMVIAIEEHRFNMSEPSKSELHNYLAGKGYHLYAGTGATLIFKLTR